MLERAEKSAATEMAGTGPQTEDGARFVTVGAARRRLAVRLDGSLEDPKKIPVVCLAGLVRNSSDFAALVGHLHDMVEPDWPVVRIDLIGRGQSAREERGTAYETGRDVADVLSVLWSLGIGRATWVGENHGGQVIELMAVTHPGAIAGAALIDAGPVIDVRGLVRLRTNLEYLGEIRGEAAFLDAARHILAPVYPLLSHSALDRLALRTHRVGRRGRIEPRFDPRIVRALAEFENTDVLATQWQIFDALGHAPLMIMRTELSDLLRADVFDKMARRRPGAVRIDIPNEGSPALLDGPSETGSLAGFVSVVSAEDRKAKG